MKHGRQQKSQPAPWDARACGFTIDNFASKETTKQTICANGTNNKNIIHEHKQTDERHTNNDSQVTRPVARLRPRGAWLPSPSSMDNGPNSTDPTIVGIHPVLIRKQTSTQTKENGKKTKHKTGKTPVALQVWSPSSFGMGGRNNGPKRGRPNHSGYPTPFSENYTNNKRRKTKKIYIYQAQNM